MRKLLMVVSTAALAALGASVVTAQDDSAVPTSSTERTYGLAGFEEVSVVGPHHVIVSVGNGFSVRAEGPTRTLDDTRVEVEDGRLEIHPVEDRWKRRRQNRDGNGYRDGHWDNYEPATFHVTLPRISGASLVGGGEMRIDRVEGSGFSASVAGSGELDVAALRVDDARFSIAGSGDLTARGSARQSRVSIAGSGHLRAREVTSSTASVSIAGSGNAELTVQNDARVSIVGSGDVEIAGSARCSVSRMGSGKVRCNGDTVTS